MSTANIFDIIANASASAGGNYFDKHGKYVLANMELKLKDGNEGLCFISEWLVLESYPIALTDDKGVHPPGDHRSIVWNFKKHKSAPSNTKALLLGLCGVTETEADPNELKKFLADITSDKQPLKGKAIVTETYNKKIATGANAGQLIMLHNWTHVPEKPAEWAARAASWAASPSGVA